MPSNVTVIVPEADVATENAWMKANIDRAAGEYSLVAPLTKDGTTIYGRWFSNQWPDAKAAALIAHYGINAYTGTPDEALAAAGLTRYSPTL